MPNLDIGLDPKHYFKVGNHEDLAQQLTSNISAAPRSEILAKFDWDQIAQDTYRKLGDVCNG